MEDKKKNPAIKKTMARLALVQYLYSCYLSDLKLSSLEATKFLNLYFDKDINIKDLKPCSKHFSKVFSYMQLFKEQAEEKLDSILMQRSFENNDPLIKSILVTAAVEKIGDEKLPPKVLLNEYTNIASSLYDKDHVGFINAALNDFVGRE
ncbi:MAG: hypothetical protein J0G32_07295 [Alphaproteobacteria bacterium]|nr:hypothetical protein [Alphaproteobacteria bacterium]OJV13517.1 MAG: hypothetical protein BGO27_04855 [Alphaproteobacteria bacterium 33-17]